MTLNRAFAKKALRLAVLIEFFPLSIGSFALLVGGAHPGAMIFAVLHMPTALLGYSSAFLNTVVDIPGSEFVLAGILVISQTLLFATLIYCLLMIKARIATDAQPGAPGDGPRPAGSARP